MKETAYVGLAREPASFFAVFRKFFTGRAEHPLTSAEDHDTIYQVIHI